jgi:hypothetical protein
MKYNKKRKVDFAKLYKEDEQKNKSLKLSTVFTALILTFVVISVIYYTKGLYDQNDLLKSQISEIETYINDANNISMVEEVNQKDQEIIDLVLVSDDLDSVATLIKLYPEFGSEFVDKLDYEDVDILNIQYNVSNIIIQVKSSEISTATKYVRYLKETNLFYSVGYNGLAKSSDDTTTEYSFAIDAIIARGDNNE